MKNLILTLILLITAHSFSYSQEMKINADSIRQKNLNLFSSGNLLSQETESRELRQYGVSEVYRLIDGRIAGVSVQNTSNTFGAMPFINIRGKSSLAEDDQPLWVVDGVILENAVDLSWSDLASGNAATLISTALSAINPEDIESIQVLRDGSETAIYGARAKAGVFLITTKKGKPGHWRLNYTGEYTSRIKPNYQDFNLLNSQQEMLAFNEMESKGWLGFSQMNTASNSGVYGKMYELISTYDPVTGQPLLENTSQAMKKYLQQAEMRNTDWFDELFQNNIMSNHSLSFSTGGEKTTVYASLSALVDPGWYKQSSVNRYTANVNVSHAILPNLSLNVRGNGAYRSQQAPGTTDTPYTGYGEMVRNFETNPYWLATHLSRTMDSQTFYRRNYATFNPIHELENNATHTDVWDAKLQAQIQWQMIRGLELSVSGSYQYAKTSQEHQAGETSNQALAYRAGIDPENVSIRYLNPYLYRNPDDPNALPESFLPEGGIYSEKENTLQNYYLRAVLQWTPALGDKHQLRWLAGGERFKRTKKQVSSSIWDNLDIDRYYYVMPDIKIPEFKNLSGFSEIQYVFREKYGLTGVLRYDHTTLNHYNRQETFGLSGFWDIHRESFWKTYENTVSRLSVKTAYSQIYSNRDISQVDSEKQKEWSINAIAGLFGNCINLDASWYTRRNDDMIVPVWLSGISGSSVRLFNAVDVESQGVELNLSTLNINRHNFHWQTQLIFAYQTDKVLISTPDIDSHWSDNRFFVEGKPVQSLYSVPFVGLNEEGLPVFLNENGEKTTQYYLFSAINTQDLQYEGPTLPPYFAGINNYFRIGRFGIELFFAGSFGHKVRLNPVTNPSYSDFYSLSGDLLNRWIIPGDENSTDIPAILSQQQLSTNPDLTNAGFAYNYSSARIADAGFVQLKDIALAYYVPQKWLKGKLNNLSVELRGGNLWLLYFDKRMEGQAPGYIATGGVSSPAPKQLTLTLRMGI